MKALKFLLIGLAICSFVLAIVSIVDYAKVANAINDANNALGSIGAGKINTDKGTFKFILELLFYILIGCSSISILYTINDLYDSLKMKFRSVNKKLLDLEDKVKNNN